MTRAIVAMLLVVVAAPALCQGPATSTSEATGRVLCQYWRGLGGNRVADLLAAPAYPAFPTEQVELEQLEIPDQDEGDFGTVLRGWLHPPQDGNYVLCVAGDNQCELWLSTDDSLANLALVASVPDWSGPRQWDRDPRQQSHPVRMQRGRRYAVEVRHKDGGGASSLAVAWTLPDGTREAPIPGHRLSAAAPVEVPLARVTGTPAEIPSTPGIHRMDVEVNCLGQRVVVPMVLTWPRGREAAYPVLVAMPDAEASIDSAAGIPGGPCQLLAGDTPLAAWSPFIVVSPQPASGCPWDGPVYPRAAAAAVDHLLGRLPADPHRLYLVGSGTGSMDMWRMLLHLKARPAAITSLCGWDMQDAALIPKVSGSLVWIVAGTRHGMSTEHSNRMAQFLSGIRPPVKIDYDNARGKDVADFLYSRQQFYEQLLAWRREPGRSAEQRTKSGRSWYTASAGAAGIATLLVLAFLYARRVSRAVPATRGRQ